MNVNILATRLKCNFLKVLQKGNTTCFIRLRYYWKTMDSVDLQPPREVRGMRDLRRDAFRKLIKVPCIKVQSTHANRVLPLIKDKLLKMQHLRPVRDIKEGIESTNEGSVCETNLTLKEVLLHPAAVNSWDSLPIEKLQHYNITSADFYFSELELTYDNWRADEILDFVLSDESEGLSSYSRIGHVIHLNLREHLLPYKKLIAEVLTDKLNGVRTVVNKSSNIDNTYRNFELELLHGEANYQVETKENGIYFEFDFSRVYWNPRLSTEHERIVKMLRPKDILYDVFAGVGPFSVPAAKKGCHVLANDLNPDSYRWLDHNLKRNKCADKAKIFNKDGFAFIEEDIKEDLLIRLRQPKEPNDMHITMNLPAMATEFLPAFRGLLSNSYPVDDFKYPTVHVYTFAKGEDTKSLALCLTEKNLGHTLTDNLLDVCFVRNVAPKKDMYRVSFQLTKSILFDQNKEDTNPRNNKRSLTDPIEIEIKPKVQCSSNDK